MIIDHTLLLLIPMWKISIPCNLAQSLISSGYSSSHRFLHKQIIDQQSKIDRSFGPNSFFLEHWNQEREKEKDGYLQNRLEIERLQKSKVIRRRTSGAINLIGDHNSEIRRRWRTPRRRSRSDVIHHLHLNSSRRYRGILHFLLGFVRWFSEISSLSKDEK